MPYANIWLSARTMVCKCAVGIKYLAMHHEIGGSVSMDVIYPTLSNAKSCYILSSYRPNLYV